VDGDVQAGVDAKIRRHQQPDLGFHGEHRLFRKSRPTSNRSTSHASACCFQRNWDFFLENSGGPSSSALGTSKAAAVVAMAEEEVPGGGGGGSGRTNQIGDNILFFRPAHRLVRRRRSDSDFSPAHG